MSDRLTIIDTIDKDGTFSTFARMLRTTKAADLMTGAGPFTVFAPTNDAFGKVPDKQMNGWLSQTDQTNLAKILSYHIVPAKLFASNLSGKAPAKTLSGEEVTFSDTNGLKVNGSGLLARNIEATNGIVHAIDTVLIPSSTAISASAMTSAGTAVPNTAGAVTPPTPQADGHGDTPPVNTEAAPAAGAPRPNSTTSVL